MQTDQIATHYRIAMDKVQGFGMLSTWMAKIIRYLMFRAWGGDDKAQDLLIEARFVKDPTDHE